MTRAAASVPMSDVEVVIKRRGKLICDRRYWTGSSWSTLLRFAKRYTPAPALEVVRRRFLDMDPQPIVRVYASERRIPTNLPQ